MKEKPCSGKEEGQFNNLLKFDTLSKVYKINLKIYWSKNKEKATTTMFKKA